MNSLDSILFQLSSGLVSETAVPTTYLDIPQIAAAIIRFNWALRGSNIPGWTTLVRVINYSS